MSKKDANMIEKALQDLEKDIPPDKVPPADKGRIEEARSLLKILRSKKRMFKLWRIHSLRKPGIECSIEYDVIFIAEGYNEAKEELIQAMNKNSRVEIERGVENFEAVLPKENRNKEDNDLLSKARGKIEALKLKERMNFQFSFIMCILLKIMDFRYIRQ